MQWMYERNKFGKVSELLSKAKSNTSSSFSRLLKYESAKLAKRSKSVESKFKHCKSPGLYSMKTVSVNGFELFICHHSNEVVFITHNRTRKAELRNTFAKCVCNRRIISFKHLQNCSQ